MELKTQALDRLLGLLSPALSQELDRLVQETTEKLEQEYQQRLQQAVSDAESAAQDRAASAQQQAVEEARDSARKRAAEELEQQFQQRLAEATQASDRLKAEAAAEREQLRTQLEQWRVFAEAQQQLAEASSQPEILSRFLKLAESFTGGLAIYVVKPDGLALWKSRGRAAFPDIVSKDTTDPEAYFRSVTVRGKAVAAVCAVPPFKRDVLEFLSASLERAVEGFGLKLRSPLPKPVVTEKTVAVAAAAYPTGDGNTDDQKAHTEARRTARLLVSEIKLYHEQELENGRQHRDIYERLRKEIDLGRETYMDRVPRTVLAAHDYFHEEVVRILGEDDASRLGPAYPGPIQK
jgi:hypothetical protein